MENIDVDLIEKISENKRYCKKMMNSLTEGFELYKNARLVGSEKVIAKIKLNKAVDRLELEIKQRNGVISGFEELEKDQRKYFIHIRENIKKM